MIHDNEIVRLQKYLAMCGVASRRKSEELILQGRIKVNGSIVLEMGFQVSQNDKVEYDGHIVLPERRMVYIMLNKPYGYVTTVSDQFSRSTVLDLIDGVSERIFPVGRLDYDTSGLLLLTNDGDLTYKYTHPKYEVPKTYRARVKGIPDDSDLERLRGGLKVEDYITAPAIVDHVSTVKGNAVLEIKIHEGHNRQVRKMLEAVKYPVLDLKRTAEGSLFLDGLKEGSWRYLTRNEISVLKGEIINGRSKKQ